MVKSYPFVTFLRTHALFVTLLIAHFALPMLLWGSIVARVHDNLDSEVVYSVVIGRFWAAGADNSVFQVFLGGVLNWTDFARVLHPLTLIYAAFPAPWAYAITEVIILVLAYAGFRALLSVLDLPANAVLPCLAAFGLSYPSYGLGLAGAPLLLAFIFARGRPHGWEWGAVALLGLNSAFAIHALFVPIAVLALAAITGRRPITIRLVGLLGLYLATALLGASGLILSVLTGAPSFREEWVRPFSATPIADWVTETIENMLALDGAYFAIITPAIHVPFILVAALLAGQRRAAMVVIAMMAAAEAVRVALPFLGTLGGPLASIGWYRFIWFVPFFVLLLAAMVQSRMVQVATRFSLVLWFLAGIGIVPSLLKYAVPPEQASAIRETLRTEGQAAAFKQALPLLSGIQLSNLFRGVETWKNHTRPEAYECIRAAWKSDSGGRVISHGPDPMLAPLHGIPSIDGYHNYYPLAYKHAFRPVIADQLDADPELATYFDNWGGRVETLARRAKVPAAINWSAAAALGATHVIADRNVESLALVATCGSMMLYRISR